STIKNFIEQTPARTLLEAFVLREFRFLPGAGKRPAHPHLFYAERAGGRHRKRSGTYLRWARRGRRRYICSDRDNAAAHFLTRLRLTRFRQRIRNNLHDSTDGHLVIKLGNVLRFHTDAAVTCGTTNLVFLRRAMNINTTLKRVCVLRLEPA